MKTDKLLRSWKLYGETYSTLLSLSNDFISTIGVNVNGKNISRFSANIYFNQNKIVEKLYSSDIEELKIKTEKFLFDRGYKFATEQQLILL